MNTDATKRPWMVKGTSKFDENQFLRGNDIPTIRFGGMDAIFASYGATPDECKAKRDEVFEAVNNHERLLVIEGAAQKVLAAFEAGVFVRSIDEDHKSDWAVKALPRIAALGALQNNLSSTVVKIGARIDGLSCSVHNWSFVWPSPPSHSRQAGVRML